MCLRNFDKCVLLRICPPPVPHNGIVRPSAMQLCVYTCHVRSNISPRLQCLHQFWSSGRSRAPVAAFPRPRCKQRPSLCSFPKGPPPHGSITSFTKRVQKGVSTIFSRFPCIYTSHLSARTSVIMRDDV